MNTTVRSRLGQRWLLASLALLPWLGGDLVAQAPAGDSSVGARALLDLDLRLAEMASRTGFVAGARALVEIAPGFRVGVGAHQVLRRLDDVPSRTGPGRTMAFGYAGAVIEMALPYERFVARGLAGAGTVTIRDQAVGTRTGSDIVAVVAPELMARLISYGRLSLTAGAGWRLVFSVDGPARIGRQDLATPFVSVSVRLGPFE